MNEYKVYIEPNKKLYLGSIKAKDEDEAYTIFYDKNPNIADYLDGEISLELDYLDYAQKQQSLIDEYNDRRYEEMREKELLSKEDYD